MLTADITSGAFYEACTRLTPTLLIDEVGTHASNHRLRHLLRMGTTRDVVGIRHNRVVRVYGPKVISLLKAPDDAALNTRCILISMTEANTDGLPKASDSALEQKAQILQAQLLQFRLQNYGQLNPPSLPGTTGLRPRTKDLLTCLATAAAEDAQRVDYLVGFFKFDDTVRQEPLPPEEDAVLAALFCLLHVQPKYTKFSGNCLRVTDLTCLVNDVLEKSKARLRVNELVKVHGLDSLASHLLVVPPEKCPKCREVKIANAYRAICTLLKEGR